MGTRRRRPKNPGSGNQGKVRRGLEQLPRHSFETIVFSTTDRESAEPGPRSARTVTSTETDTATGWRCPRCETVAKPGQRFCRQCGHQHATDAQADPSGEIERTGPTMRPVSRLLIALIVVLFI